MTQDRAPSPNPDAQGRKAWLAQLEALIATGDFAGAERGLADAADPSAETRIRVAWGRALAAKGDLAGAEAQFARAAALAPRSPDVQAELGLVQLKLGLAEEAAERFAQVLSLAPRHISSLINRGTALKALGRMDEAEASYRGALQVEPGHAAAVRNLCILLTLTERHADALKAADRALSRARTPEAFIARGDAHYGLGRFEDALTSYLQASKLASDPYETMIKQGLARTALRQYPEALALLDQAVALRPADHLAYHRRAPARLVTHDFEGGWKDYEYRWENDLFRSASAAMVSPQVRQHLHLRLSVDDLRGQRVLLVGEQGIGDQVMFASMIPDLVKVAASVTCVCDDRLVSLFSNAFPGVSFTGPLSANLSRSAFDRVVAMGSLGHVFRNRIEDFPGEAYLRPRDEACERWAARLGPRPQGLRIGISWRGGTPSTERATRSLALTDFAPLLDLPACEAVSLQYGDAREEVAAVNAGLKTPIRIFPAAEIDDFEALSGLISNLDMVVSVQTSVVHLTGALGKEALVMVPYNPIWRYGASGSAMPWYRSVRLFRQPRPQAWEPVIAQVVDAVGARLSR